MANIRLFFSDFFSCSESELKAHGALNVSLIADLPLFIDPFLLFNSKKPEYVDLHNQMIEYVGFLEEQANIGSLPSGLLKSWFMFPEVKQNWLGYSLAGNDGRGLGPKFAAALHSNLRTVLKRGDRKLTRGTHIERLCLIKSGVGRDNISDFTTNLTKSFLLEYTERFATIHIDPSKCKSISVEKVKFNWDTQTWESRQFNLPWFRGDYVLLTPEDILTKDDVWISQQGLFHRFSHIVSTIPNDQLRAQLDNYFTSKLPQRRDKKPPTQEQRHSAMLAVAEKYPQLLDYYIKEKEADGSRAQRVSAENVERIKTLFIDQVGALVGGLERAGFYELANGSYRAAMGRVKFLKTNIEDNDGYRLFYVNNEPVQREADLQRMFRLTWYASDFEVDAEVNNGRGPVDYKISSGSSDKTLVEFKLANNTKLEQNLANQLKIYERANHSKNSIKVIMYFSLAEQGRVQRILERRGLKDDKSIVLIDCRSDNKPSASKATDSTESDGG